MACSSELEFEAPLARFDVEEWTEFYDQNDSSPDADENGSCSAGEIRKLQQRSYDNLNDLHHSQEASESFAVPALPETGRKSLLVLYDRPSSGSSSAAGSGFAEQFGETSLSGSLEDLVNTFDENVTKCCKNFQEEVEKLAPVQIRSVEEAMSDCQNWYTLTGNYGNLLPINWTGTVGHLRQSSKRSELSQSEDDVEDDEEQFCSVEELDQITGDILNTVSSSKFEDNESLDDVDNADDVIDELEALMDERDVDYTEVELPANHEPPRMTVAVPDEVNCQTSTAVNGEAWFKNDLEKLSSAALKQLSVDLLRTVVEFNNLLRQELTVSDELKRENRLCRDLIALTLKVERKLKLHQHQTADPTTADDDDDDERSSDGNSYLATVIPYRPSDGRLTVQRLQIYITLLTAIEEDDRRVPRLLTDYILNVLCPVN